MANVKYSMESLQDLFKYHEGEFPRLTVKAYAMENAIKEI